MCSRLATITTELIRKKIQKAFPIPPRVRKAEKLPDITNKSDGINTIKKAELTPTPMMPHFHSLNKCNAFFLAKLRLKSSQLPGTRHSPTREMRFQKRIASASKCTRAMKFPNSMRAREPMPMPKKRLRRWPLFLRST